VEKGGREAKKRIETHEGQFLALITESDRESSGIYIDMGWD